MEQQKTSLFSNGLIWLGAAVSIAEIMTGTLFAPLGFQKGLAAILIGHVIGCALLYLSGLIGAKTGKSAMETVKMSFGQKGALLFAALNVLQLLGWTAVMIVSGARAAQTAASPVMGGLGGWFWCLVIGGLILLWISRGPAHLSRLNTVAMGALFILTVILSTVIFGGEAGAGNPGAVGELLSFGTAVELSVAMPLSWLPLISDYTREAQKPRKAAAVSAAVYFMGSCWMYLIGMGAAIFTGESDIATVLVKAGMGFVGVLIVVISTVTTTFLDAYSAGVSAVSIRKTVSEKKAAAVVCGAGTLLAVFTPVEQFENFLYLIGSVFAPMIAVQITDAFLLKKDRGESAVCWTNIVLWAVGFVLYRIFMRCETPLGSTVPVMVIMVILCAAVNGIQKRLLGTGRDCRK